MSGIPYWSVVEEKRRELVQEYVVNRKAKIAAGEPDPYPGQPSDYQSLYLASVKLPPTVDPDSREGQICCLNFAFAARKICGENGHQTHRVATQHEIERYWEDEKQRAALSRKAEDRLNARRTVNVRAVQPAQRGA